MRVRPIRFSSHAQRKYYLRSGCRDPEARLENLYTQSEAVRPEKAKELIPGLRLKSGFEYRMAHDDEIHDDVLLVVSNDDTLVTVYMRGLSGLYTSRRNYDDSEV